ncbi:hypothetical protein COU78_02365 [Candidatus Peregrinibacteria bacterium CG10_big_fil_rev_8_21_14_0_10_49_24]|nr:MAG: hypothetical protein COV83_02345 [Candidatus Peregrinibacteria bacterium CG11_big_fil_rev_8_21_14_0_20_49_14]PIR50981.1 MAG: hypothetical protein COU78_02365 [Candidatus Peregrinibacteria bacterium CG10_big_fil_rev_8_21_14_0_10_49_24]PJA67534.1 MAG: hypothetical protein CO157_03845 [Candidatus Peregrinibacteria bacterium CG_4_9_14_3_um_filter_49_12]
MVGVALILLVLFAVGKMVLSYFGVGNAISQLGTTLTMQREGNVQVSIEGGELKRAENEQKLYPGDTVVTGPSSRAMLTFFDGTKIHLDEMTNLSVSESAHGQEKSVLSVFLKEGTIWIASPDKKAFSGAIQRSVSTPFLESGFPSRTEAVMTSRSIVVFSADGIGVTLEPDKAVIPIIVGEGQKFVLPAELTGTEDLYVFRSPLDPYALASDFVEESRNILLGDTQKNTVTTDVVEQPPLEEDEALIVNTPKNDATISLSTVDVSGQVGRKVSRVRVNGYNAPVDVNARTFSQQLALPDQDDVEIVVVALSQEDEVLSEVRRQVHRDRKPPEQPKILRPAKNGETYNTNSERFLIEGTAPQGTVGISVNDYRLQLFEPGNRTWSYLASTSINNLKPGKNTYKVVAINKGGYKSEPAILTIVLGEGPEGVVRPEGETVSSQPASTAVEDATPEALPANAPLKAGSLRVTGPTPGTVHTATGTSFLIEGTTLPETYSLWVNDYRLRLYEPGKTTWNYIADTQLGTLKRGRNAYKIVTRNAKGEILDTLTYVVQY